uniref:Uncharacterized protein n=1 Tax=Kalanchoe fedtschenkoi TaxID=63787 RepID=A0A7N0RFQ7_KALFE
MNLTLDRAREQDGQRRSYRTRELAMGVGRKCREAGEAKGLLGQNSASLSNHDRALTEGLRNKPPQKDLPNLRFNRLKPL